MLFFCTIFSLTIYGKQNTIIKKGKALKIETINSFKNWLGIETIYENGIIENNKKEYILILKIIPINFNLKSEIEKEVILNNYKKIFSNLEIEIQIFIKNKKINLEKNKKYIIENNNSIISKQYINYLETLNNNKKTTNKEYYLIIKNKNKEKLKEIILKINEQLNQCKNKTEKLNKNEIEELIKTTLITGDE